MGNLGRACDNLGKYGRPSNTTSTRWKSAWPTGPGMAGAIARAPSATPMPAWASARRPASITGRRCCCCCCVVAAVAVALFVAIVVVIIAAAVAAAAAAGLLLLLLPLLLLLLLLSLLLSLLLLLLLLLQLQLRIPGTFMEAAVVFLHRGCHRLSSLALMSSSFILYSSFRILHAPFLITCSPPSRFMPSVRASCLSAHRSCRIDLPRHTLVCPRSARCSCEVVGMLQATARQRIVDHVISHLQFLAHAALAISQCLCCLHLRPKAPSRHAEC